MKHVELIVADWCPQCPAAKALWRGLSEQHAFTLTEVDIASEQGRELVVKHGIRGVPTALIDGAVAFAGRVVNREVALDAVIGARAAG